MLWEYSGIQKRSEQNQFPSSIAWKIFSYRLFNHKIVSFRVITVYSMVTLKPSIRYDISSVLKWIKIHQYWKVCTMAMVNIQRTRNNKAHGVLGQNPILRRPIWTEREIVLVGVILSRRDILEFYVKIYWYRYSNLYSLLRKVWLGIRHLRYPRCKLGYSSKLLTS